MKVEFSKSETELLLSPLIETCLIGYNEVLNEVTSLHHRNNIQDDFETKRDSYFANSKKAAYLNNVFHQLNSVLNLLNRLGYIPYLVKRLSINPTYLKRGLTKHEWVKYQYSNYLIYSNTFFDTILLLINDVLLLGLEHNYCKYEKVKKRLSNHSELKKSLINLKNHVKEAQRKRHLLIHRNITPENERLDKIETQLFIYRSLKKSGKNIAPLELEHERLLSRVYNQERKVLFQDLEKKTDHFNLVAKEILDLLFPSFQEIIEQI